MMTFSPGVLIYLAHARGSTFTALGELLLPLRSHKDTFLLSKEIGQNISEPKTDHYLQCSSWNLHILELFSSGYFGIVL